VRSTLRNGNVEQFEILNFAEKADKNRVEVDTDETFFSLVIVFTEEQELVELIVSVLLDSRFPLADLLIFKLTKILDKRIVKLLYILVLFTLQNRSGKLAKAVHGVRNALVQAFGPIKGTGNWRSIAGDRGTFVNTFNKDFAFKENLLNTL
jgi:hypothetical protein